jgi:starch-binding outer membrane protein, SusD/RagB family
MLPEAQGNSASSIDLINQVRTRSSAPAIVATGITTTKLFEDTLSNERRIEFAFENQRWFDLLRYNTTMTTITAEGTMKAHFAKEYPVHYKDYPAPALTLDQLQAQVTKDKLLLPIPQREIDTNTQLVIPQNPGY